MKELPKKDQLPFIMAVCSYVFEEESKPLTGGAYAAFLLVKPILDKASKKAASGKQGGSKPKANRKQTESNKEGEIEKEVEIEIDDEYNNPPNPLSTVMSAYMDKINPQPSETCIGELKGFTEHMGAEVCLRAINIAMDERKTYWSYIRAILRDKQSRGVKCLADWDRLEEGRKHRGAGEDSNPATGSGGNGAKWNVKSALDDCD